jgi:hypothetical protein
MVYSTVAPDPLDSVSSVLPGYYFHCPDAFSVDRHIAERREHMGPLSNLTPKFKEAARQDVDRLLDRRLYLMSACLADPRLDSFTEAKAA